MINNPENLTPGKEKTKELSPSHLALFPTNRCNMKCRYCYAAHEFKVLKNMPKETAESAVEYYISHILKTGNNLFGLEFHGGGEPFAAWDLVKHIVEYAEKRCAHENLRLKIHGATNGVLKKDQLHWITRHFHSLLVSFDGLPHVQDFHRPMGNNEDSFKYLDQTMKYFDHHNFPYGIRCAVSRFNEDILDETIDFIRENYNTNLVFMEPVHICRNTINNRGIKKPDFYKFIENYKTLEPLCAKKGLRLEYSGAQFTRISANFCQAGTDDFAVTHEGYLTNCWEVTDKAHPFSETFIFGKILPGGKISIDQEKLDYLRTLSVKNIEYCRDCFAKWHCAGDCLTKLGHNQFKGPRGGDRCITNRQIILHRIFRLLET
ncbi:radical SAM/SPASM domain-containing protein [Desulfonema limicola]